MQEQDIEIQNAKQTIDLLKSYSVAKTQQEKDSLLNQIHSTNYGAYILITKRNFEPDDLADKIEKVIKLNEYRPKNLNIMKMAADYDLENIGGEFNTFDRKLSKMIKNNEDPESIRKRFVAGTFNIYMLSKQFAADWIQRLNNHKDLVAAARNATEENAIDAYDKLFKALTKDFCEQYDCHIDSKVITDWAAADFKPKDGWDMTNGYQLTAHGLDLPKDISKDEKAKILSDFHKTPDEYPGAYRESYVRINISVTRKNHPEPADFFYTMIISFAHEMHHALDYQKPRQGALGPQIEEIDRKTYVLPTKNEKAYHESATEISSYQIQHELFDQLKNMQFYENFFTL